MDNLYIPSIFVICSIFFIITIISLACRKTKKNMQLAQTTDNILTNAATTATDYPPPYYYVSQGPVVFKELQPATITGCRDMLPPYYYVNAGPIALKDLVFMITPEKSTNFNA